MTQVVEVKCQCTNSDLYTIGEQLGYNRNDIHNNLNYNQMYGTDGRGYCIITKDCFFEDDIFNNDILNNIIKELMIQSNNQDVYVLDD